MKNQIELEEMAFFVKTGGDFTKFTKKEIIDLQDYALTVRDISLYDRLETYWVLKNFGKK